MQIVNGMAPDRMTIRDAIKMIPARLVALMRRLASLQPGRYVIIFNVGQDDMYWEIAPFVKVERLD